MKRFTMVASAIMLVVMFFLLNNNTLATGIVADDPEAQMDTWSENEIAKISRKISRESVRPGLGKASVVEYFGDAHKKSLLNQAKEAGFTTVQAQGLIDTALIEKRTLKGKGPQALTNFYVKLDEKRADDKDVILAEVDRRIAEAKADGLAEGARALETMKSEIEAKIVEAKVAGLAEGMTYVDKVANNKTAEFNKVLEDPTTGLKATYNLAQSVSDGLVQTNLRLDDMNAAWGIVAEDTNAAINKVDRKARLVDAKVNYLGGRAKVNKDKTTGNKLVFPSLVDGEKVDIGEKVLPVEQKDSATTGKKDECK